MNFSDELRDLARRRLDRRVRRLPPGLLDLSSNDYLDLARHPRVVAAAAEAARRFGASARASRLVSGHYDLLDELETALARTKGAEAALVCPTGWQAALAGIGATVGPRDAVFVEKLSHASLVDAARLSGAKFRVFRADDPEAALRAARGARKRGARRILFVADGVTSMDGTIFPLPDFLPPLAEIDAWLFLDDAHATGVLGPRGEGTLAHFGLSPNPRLLQMGTLSKALGSQGGFLAGPRDWIRLVVTKGRAFVYATGLAPPAAAAARAALSVIAEEPARLGRLRAATAALRGAVERAGRRVLSDPSVPIVPVPFDSIEAAFAAEEALARAGYYSPAIRPPTVRTPRLRLTANAGVAVDARALAEALSVIRSTP